MNLGILAHIDAGKTSLTERLLFDAGARSSLGSVDEGDTYTDSLEVERRRGITVKSAVAGLSLGKIDVNIVDTPGHPDFIAEVERVLGILDGVVLVLSAVEGVQAQTRVLFRTLKRLKIPMLMFVNKIDRMGARSDGLVADIRDRLEPNVLRMSHVNGAGTIDALSVPRSLDDPRFAMELAERLAEHNDEALEAFVEGEWNQTSEHLFGLLAAEVRAARLLPVFFGSATLGTGIDDLMHGIKTFLPRAGGSPENPLSAVVFKIERGSNNERIAYLRVFDGTLALRTKQTFDCDRAGRVTHIELFRRGEACQAKALLPGDIGRVWGLGDVRIGDTIGSGNSLASRRFSPPTLETLIVPKKATERGALLSALTELSEQDPLINVRQDDLRQQIYVSLFGDVQKEVIGENLLTEYGIDVAFRETTTVCIERVVGTGEAVEKLKTPGNPFLATVGFRIEPLPLDTGNRFGLEVELGSIPLAFHRAVEETALKTLEQGLYGWNVQDCLITMIDSGYLARQSHSYSAFDKSMSSTAGDFRNLTPLVLMDALRRAETMVCEPINSFYLEIPVDLVGAVFPVLTRHGAAPHAPSIFRETAAIEGTIAAGNVHELRLMLPHVTRGEGAFESNFDHYEPITDRKPPIRRRTDSDPTSRKRYLSNLGIRLQ